MSFQKVVNVRANVQAMNIIRGIQKMIGSALTGKGKNVMAEAKAYKMIPHCTKDTITYDMDELVRCKDCEHYDEKTGRCAKHHVHGYAETWFCADGERKDR